MAVIRIGKEKITDVTEAKNAFMKTFGLSEDNAYAYMIIQVGFANEDTEEMFIADVEETEKTRTVSDTEYLERYLSHPEAKDIEFEGYRRLEPVKGIWELL